MGVFCFFLGIVWDSLGMRFEYSLRKFGKRVKWLKRIGLGLLILLVIGYIWQFELVNYGIMQLRGQLRVVNNSMPLEDFLELPETTEEQKEKYLKPLCEGTARSCFAMTEPEVAGSDPTLIKTTAYQDGDEWVVNGHKWFISGARGAKFALLVARTEDDPEIPQAANSCFIVDLPSDGWEVVRDVQTMSGGHNHCEIRITDLRVPAANMLGGRGQGHLLGQYRLGPARLAHCMRWIGQAETALDMMVSRSMERYSHGSLLAEKQGIQWLIADSAVELYQCKLMVLHAAYQIEQKMDFTAVVSMAKHFVANSLWRIIDRAIQVHGALGYSTDTPLAHMLQQARWARFADGADEIHQMRIAQRTIAAFNDSGTTKAATGNLPL